MAVMVKIAAPQALAVFLHANVGSLLGVAVKLQPLKGVAILHVFLIFVVG